MRICELHLIKNLLGEIFGTVIFSIFFTRLAERISQKYYLIKIFFFQKSSFLASVVNHRGFEIPCIFTCHQLFQNFVANLDNFSKACSYLTSDSCCYLLNTSYMTRACINETDFQMDRWFMTFLWGKKIERNCYRYIV